MCVCVRKRSSWSFLPPLLTGLYTYAALSRMWAPKYRIEMAFQTDAVAVVVYVYCIYIYIHTYTIPRIYLSLDPLSWATIDGDKLLLPLSITISPMGGGTLSQVSLLASFPVPIGYYHSFGLSCCAYTYIVASSIYIYTV